MPPVPTPVTADHVRRRAPHGIPHDGQCRAPQRSTRPLAARRVAARRLAALPLAFALAGVIFGSLGASPAQAWVPHNPSSDYVPHHVWQYFNDCVWAAGQMLLDKWTHGNVRINQARLRRLSGDRKGGSNLYDLARGIRRASGIWLRFSPGYGDSMTWWQLLDRLEHHGGAVLLGEYRRLPAHFTRWSPRFAARPQGSPHAVYVQQYDRANARVWLMDPLAYGGYPGEWIDVDALRRFADFDGNLVVAAATPARHRPMTAPLIDRAYRLGAPRLTGAAIAGSTVGVHVDLSIRDGFPIPAAQRFAAHWEPIPEPAGSNVLVANAALRFTVDSRAPGAAAPPKAVPVDTASAPDRPDARAFTAAVPTPAIPGRYRLTLRLIEGGHPAQPRVLSPVDIDVHAPFSATWHVPTTVDATAGQRLELHVSVTNIGSVDWRRPSSGGDDSTAAKAADHAQTLLVLTWRSAAGDERPAARMPAELAPGATGQFKIGVVPPDQPGKVTLLVDIVNIEEGALSSAGVMTPAIAVVVQPAILETRP